MTKPVTGVALMTLYERGHFQLSDPVSRFIPSWNSMKVAERDPSGSVRLVDPVRPPSVRDLLMHMSGLGYGRDNADLNLESEGGRIKAPSTRFASLEDMVDQQAAWPLRFQPGAHWLYSFGTDVCARLVEIMSGRSFDTYLSEEIFGPLGMTDTAFYVPDAGADRFAGLYARNARKELVLLDDAQDSSYRRPPDFLSGGGGLVGTTGDYLRFCQMLLDGGELDGRRILSRKTVGSYGEVGFDGMGFGLTMSVSKGPSQTAVSGSAGTFQWGGAASTLFWVDPAEDLTVVFMTQLMPSATFNFRGQLQALVYAAIAD